MPYIIILQMHNNYHLLHSLDISFYERDFEKLIFFGTVVKNIVTGVC